MLTNLIEFAIRRRYFVTLLFVVIALASTLSLHHARIDAIPDIGEKQQIVFSEWPGRSPKDIEEQVTYPLSTAMSGIPGIKTIRASSAFGFSTIYIIFKDEVDFYWSRSRILEKLSGAAALLPEGVVPNLGPDATGLGQIYMYTLENAPDSEEPKSLAELRSIQDFYVKFLLQSVEGVSEVASIGGFVKEYQIDIDPLKLFSYGISLTALVNAVKKSNSDVGAEVIENGDREMLVRGVGFFKSLDDIRNVVVKVVDKRPIRVADVATVQIGPAFRRGALDKNGEEQVGGIVTMRFGENPKEVIDHVKQKLHNIEQGLPRGVIIKSFYDRTEVIERTISTVYSALVQEIIITVGVIIFFLLHFRSSILVSLTLPFGVGISFIAMKMLGIDSNVMSLSGLVIAIGTMVDMGIIMTEVIYSRLAEMTQKDHHTVGKHIEVVIESAKEVGPAILTAVLTTVITFLPVFALEGAEGKLFGPLAWAKTLAMLGAVIVALFLIPPLSTFFLKGKLRPIEQNPISKTIVGNYQRILELVLHHRKFFLAIPLAFFIIGCLALWRTGSEFMPSLNEGELLYMPVTTPDVSLTKARELLAYTDKVLKDHPYVVSAIGKLGRASTALDPAPVAMFETVVKLIPKDKWPKGMSIYDIMAELDQHLQVPGLVNSWDFPIQTRIGMISTGIKTQVGIKIFGPDLKMLEKIAAEVGAVVETVPHAYGVYAERITGKPYVEFHIDRVKASRYGINVGEVNSILQSAVGGMAISQFYEGRERYPIRVRYKSELRQQIDDLKKVLVPSAIGGHIPIEDLADIKIVTGPSMISSENGLLRSLVLLNVSGKDLIGFVKEAQKAVKDKVELPQGYSIDWAGQYENQARASKRLAILIPLSLLINLVIIYVGIGSWRNSLIIFSAVPIALSGGGLLLGILDQTTSVAVWVGFIALFGIAVDDGVVMMTYLQQEIKKRKIVHFDDITRAVIDAGSRRIRPLLMTTATTIFALLPVMWSTETGSEVMKPMAIPALGGMTIELITLFVVPVLFTLFEERKLKNKNISSGGQNESLPINS